MAKIKTAQQLAEEEALDAIISTPNSLEMRQRNSAGTNYVSPNLYANVPPDNAPGLIIYTGQNDIQTVTLGDNLMWTPEDDVNNIPGRLNVTVPGAVNADWSATSGAAEILNKPTLFSGAYNDLSGRPALGTAAAQSSTAFATAAQGTKADTALQPGSLAAVATTGAYADLTGKPTLGTAAAQNTTAFATAAQGVLAGTALQSGAIGSTVQPFSAALSTFSTNGSAYYLARANHTGTQAISTVTGLQAALDGKFTIPTGATSQYLRGDGSPSAFPTLVSTFSNDAGYLTSSALSGYVTNTSLSSTLSGYPTNASLATTLGGYVTTAALASALSGKFNTPSGTTAQYIRGDGTLATLPTTTAPSASGVTRALNTAFQISATRPARVFYPVTITTAFTLAGGQVGNLYLDIADDSGMTTNLESFGPWETGQTGALAIGLAINQQITVTVEGWVPAGKYARIRTVNTTGTPTFTSRRGSEVLM